MEKLKRNYIKEVAAIFGKKIGEPFIVDNGTGLKPAKIMFTPDNGIDRHDGRRWVMADYFLTPLIMGQIWEVTEYDQGSLFDD